MTWSFDLGCVDVPICESWSRTTKFPWLGERSGCGPIFRLDLVALVMPQIVAFCNLSDSESLTMTWKVRPLILPPSIIPLRSAPRSPGSTSSRVSARELSVGVFGFFKPSLSTLTIASLSDRRALAPCRVFFVVHVLGKHLNSRSFPVTHHLP